VSSFASQEKLKKSGTLPEGKGCRGTAGKGREGKDGNRPVTPAGVPSFQDIGQELAGEKGTDLNGASLRPVSI
jgi:hypothetical protein